MKSMHTMLTLPLFIFFILFASSYLHCAEAALRASVSREANDSKEVIAEQDTKEAVAHSVRECIICRDTIEPNSYDILDFFFCCSHENEFHQDCINRWSKTKNACPICRTELMNRRSISLDTVKQFIIKNNDYLLKRAMRKTKGTDLFTGKPILFSPKFSIIRRIYTNWVSLFKLALKHKQDRCAYAILSKVDSAGTRSLPGGTTALMLACEYRRPKIVEYLLQKRGAHKIINATDLCEETALMKAAQSGSTECVDILHNFEVDHTPRSLRGWTALMFAANRGAGVDECIGLLSIMGDRSAQDRYTGKTAYDLACDAGASEYVQTILKP